MRRNASYAFSGVTGFDILIVEKIVCAAVIKLVDYVKKLASKWVFNIYYVSYFTLQCTNSNVHSRSCVLVLFESMFEMLLHIAVHDQHGVVRQNDV